MSEELFLLRILINHNPMVVWIIERKSVMAVIEIPGELRDLSIPY